MDGKKIVKALNVHRNNPTSGREETGATAHGERILESLEGTADALDPIAVQRRAPEGRHQHVEYVHIAGVVEQYFAHTLAPYDAWQVVGGG